MSVVVSLNSLHALFVNQRAVYPADSSALVFAKGSLRREDAAAAEKGGEIKKTSYYTAHDLVYKCDESTALITLHPALGLRQRFNPVPSQPPRMPNNARNAVPPIHSFSILALHLVLRNTIQTSAATN
ncbi:hypothetical protein PTI98_009288 [Pleurotus ostreatus]|nr:hypothetical protein PTI98_009288 [Pleurotus ostreatus]